MVLDSTDAKILEVLQKNCRASVSDLSKQVNLSLSAVSERLKKLENSDIVTAYTAIINPAAMGKDLQVILQVALENTSAANTRALMNYVDNNPDILECHHVTGDYDYALMVTTKNTTSLEKLMSDIKNFPSVRHCSTIVIMSTSKKLYSVAPVAGK